MSKTKKVVHISAGHADLDPEFTISVGNVPFRNRGIRSIMFSAEETALPTGQASGLVALELFSDAGVATFAKVTGEDAWNSDTPVIGGENETFTMLYLHPGFIVPSVELGPGLRLIGKGRFVVAPPTLDCDGIPYIYCATGDQLQPSPDVFLRQLAMTPPGGRMTKKKTPQLKIVAMSESPRRWTGSLLGLLPEVLFCLHLCSGINQHS
jgi:hypothetical protein